MSTYAIGDIQGCFGALERLLTHIQFNPVDDTLWLVGDLVNRGPQSLEVLRFIKSLGEKHQTVLGNHDLHLLAVARGATQLRQSDTLDAILAAPDCDELMEWLRHRPLLVRDQDKGYVMTHAGIAPVWDLQQAERLAKEVGSVLRGDQCDEFLKNMYGNQPDHWDEALAGVERLRCITNYFTRMRLCHRDGRLDLSYKGDMQHKPAELIPWFEVEGRKKIAAKIIFGHWAALEGRVDVLEVYALDTGCVWGNCLTAMHLETGDRFQVECATLK